MKRHQQHTGVRLAWQQLQRIEVLEMPWFLLKFNIFPTFCTCASAGSSFSLSRILAFNFMMASWLDFHDMLCPVGCRRFSPCTLPHHRSRSFCRKCTFTIGCVMPFHRHRVNQFTNKWSHFFRRQHHETKLNIPFAEHCLLNECGARRFSEDADCPAPSQLTEVFPGHSSGMQKQSMLLDVQAAKFLCSRIEVL